MSRLPWLATLALLAALLLPLRADAASIVAWDMGELTGYSDYVVEATVAERLNEPLLDGSVQTRNVLTIDRYLKGDGPARLEVVQAGGELPDGRVLVLFGDIALKPGQKVVLFARGAAPEVQATLLGCRPSRSPAAATTRRSPATSRGCPCSPRTATASSSRRPRRRSRRRARSASSAARWRRR